MKQEVERRKIKGFLAIGFVICFLSSQLWANLGIRPAYVEVELDKRRPAGRFLISNLGDTAERYRINALHFVYSEEGELRQSKTGDHSLAQWIRFNPRELTLAPKTQQAVRFAIVPRGKLEQGEYWAAMELESLRVNEITSTDEESGKSVKLRTISTIMVPIFGTVGDVDYDGVIKDVKLVTNDGAIYLRALLAATGSGRLGAIAKYEIRNTDGEILDEAPMDRAYVLRGTQRWLTRKMEVELPEEVYTIKIIVNAAHFEKPLTKQIQLRWPKLEAKTESDETPPAVNELKESDNETQGLTELTNNQSGTEPNSDG